MAASLLPARARSGLVSWLTIEKRIFPSVGHMAPPMKGGCGVTLRGTLGTGVLREQTRYVLRSMGLEPQM